MARKIDLKNKQPHRVSKDLKGKFLLLYGGVKTGKTTFGTMLPRPLLVACEPGYNALDGIMVEDCENWGDWKGISRALKDPEVKAMYDTIVIDTVDLLYKYCEKAICQEYNVETIDKFGYGKGYTLVSERFRDEMHGLARYGYGLCFLAHSAMKELKDIDEDLLDKMIMLGLGSDNPIKPSIPIELSAIDAALESAKANISSDDEEEQKEMVMSPDMTKGCQKICNALVDVMAYIATRYNEDGSAKQYLLVRNTKNVIAGSRFKYMRPVINFSYDAVIEAIQEALEKEGIEEVATDEKSLIEKQKQVEFESLQERARELGMALTTAKPGESKIVIQDIVKNIFGKQIKISDMTIDMKDKLSEFVNALEQQLEGEITE